MSSEHVLGVGTVRDSEQWYVGARAPIRQPERRRYCGLDLARSFPVDLWW
jgi:hypothetical protein